MTTYRARSLVIAVMASCLLIGCVSLVVTSIISSRFQAWIGHYEKDVRTQFDARFGPPTLTFELPGKELALLYTATWWSDQRNTTWSGKRAAELCLILLKTRANRRVREGSLRCVANISIVPPTPRGKVSYS